MRLESVAGLSWIEGSEEVFQKVLGRMEQLAVPLPHEGEAIDTYVERVGTDGDRAHAAYVYSLINRDNVFNVNVWEHEHTGEADIVVLRAQQIWLAKLAEAELLRLSEDGRTHAAAKSILRRQSVTNDRAAAQLLTAAGFSDG